MMSDDPMSGLGLAVVLFVVWLVIGVLPGYWLGTASAFPGNNDTWSCTRWENKPNGECTQYTRKEPAR